ncbi:hypothetical protein [Nocardioides psychrotolerans]|uniref:DUF559 domain-containing protein n=1 Tax=Nocardioides psychrotolerans TaxID=1005945 RepID=A0A1I3K2C9_9ACTN|nr:hypothetical protein [Nocardioides psychrotolerans]SFI66574.1 hypothetical protein SAMN05216561_111111 [Nocardioides psychrotolerans]
MTEDAEELPEPPHWRLLTSEQVGDAQRGEVRTAGHRRVSFGLYRSATQGDEWSELVKDLQAFRLVLPEGAAFTHVTGARLRGWDLPQLPRQVPVFASVPGDVARPRRCGLIVSRLVSDAPDELRHGLPVAAAEEILLRASRDLGTLDVAIMLTSALRVGDIDQQRLERLLASRRPGVRRLRAACHLSDRKCESPGEVLLKILHDVCDVPADPQVELFDDRGTSLGRADLLLRGTRHVHEYDGGHHRDKDQHRTDLRRERGLSPHYERRGFTLDDLLNHPLTVMHELDRLLERPHQLRRLHRWRSLVLSSCYSEDCRERLHMRWQRLTGQVEWQPTG